MKLYRFRNPEDAYKVLKSVLTAQIMWHYSGTTEYEKNLTKGAAIVLKNILDANRYADKISNIENKDQRLKEWNKFKKSNRIN